MAFHLMQHDRAGPRLCRWRCIDAVQNVHHCARCHTFTEDDICSTCLDPERDASRLCVVETPADQSALERTGGVQRALLCADGAAEPARWHWPERDWPAQADGRASDGVVQEVILATNFNAEGEATAHVLSEALKSRGLHVTRLARGCPWAASWSTWTWARLRTRWSIAAELAGIWPACRR